MIHYHGTPVGGPRQDAIRFLQGRHALIPYPNPCDLPAAAAVCKTFVFDNGAFSVFKQGGALDVPGYLDWCAEWCRHPGFAWALIPDVIEGTEAENDALIDQWPADLDGCPVWHFHESLDRLEHLSATWRVVALGSSGQWPTPGTDSWWQRAGEAMRRVCDPKGRPRCKLHGLRMLSPAILRRLPLHSADSTNVAQNNGLTGRFGTYAPPTAWQRAAVIAERIESAPCAAVWSEVDEPVTLF